MYSYTTKHPISIQIKVYRIFSNKFRCFEFSPMTNLALVMTSLTVSYQEKFSFKHGVIF